MGDRAPLPGTREAPPRERIWQAEIIERAIEGILTVATGGRILTINPAAERLLGVRREDVIGESFERFVPVRYREIHRQHVEAFLDSGLRAREMSSRTPVAVLRPDGSEFLAEISLVRITVEGQDAVGCIIRDISEWRRATQQLQLQARLLEQSRAAAVAFDEHGRVSYWNGAAERLYGRSREEALGKTIVELGFVDLPEPVGREIRRTIQASGEWEGDLQLRRGDHQDRIVRVTMAPVFDDEGNLVGAVSHGFDVTEQRQAASMLHAQATLLRQIASTGGLEGGLHALCELVEEHFPDVRCTVHLMEPGGERLRLAAGYRMRPPDASPDSTPGARAALSGKPVAVDDFRVAENYEPIRERLIEGGRLASMSIPVFVHGQSRGAVTLSFDRPGPPGEREQRLLETVAQLVQVAIEQDMASSARIEAQLFESVAALAAGIAHDFNNLVTSIVGNAALARMEVPPGSQAEQVLRDIELAGLRAGELAHQLLAYSGRGARHIRPQQLNTLVKEMTRLLRVSLKPGVELKLRLGSEVPPVNGDATQLRQVIMNLVLNASEAVGNAAGIVRVSTGKMEADARYLRRCRLGEQCNPGTYAYVEVRDTGAGMDQATQQRIFEPYFTTKFAGRGLGLAAVFGIVRSHGGAIALRSKPGEGTAIRILLPALEAAPPEAREARTSSGD